ncbi:hypothetical protein SPBR_03960 [Sporothrix brasiliensis 5110]|uniref:Cell wall mannoprotein PIR1-like C-terminal domain-containing protein n=1 Tax=Sporothrix brasiliensis 5110 TaxID=1398154 RepID=A0A0C2F8A6_9PEZI|nr:uncharacterized protein SPBR_03960 [Sporothrix brasiliensis 5110]KIH95289.1 hypothetical protein SPBR_03960 [Sporothrix brasiliensis 5110]
MKSTVALLSLAAGVIADGVTSAIAPKSSAPAGCDGSFQDKFEVTVVVVKNQKRDRPYMKRSTCSSNGALLLTLADGVLTDAKGRTGYIASNYQFQFDGPPQAGAIYTAGFSVCGNESLALGGSTQWWQCKSGNFYNLYDRNWAPQCEAVEIVAMPCGGSGPNAAESNDGQVVATQVITTTIVKPISDGQPQVITTTIPVPICQINDATTAANPNTGVPVSQFSDGQIQATTPATTNTAPAVVQTSDGQVQVTTPAATIAPASVKTSSAAKNGTAVPSAKTSSPGGTTTGPVPISTSGALRATVSLGSFAALAMSMAGAYFLL